MVEKNLRLAVLVSGSGTNLQALIDRSLSGSLAARIVVVASDRSDAYGLERARNAGIPAHVVDYRVFMRYGTEELQKKELPVDLVELDGVQKILKISDRDERLKRLKRLVLAEDQMIRVLDPYRPDYVCLAGFMRLVSPYFLRHFNRDGRWRVLNIHPALLPAFPGQHGYEDTFGYGCKWGGITVHFVDEGEDTGPVIAQAVYPIWPHDRLEDIRRRGLQLEYEVYAQCINWLAAGQVQVEKGTGNRYRTVVLDPSYKSITAKWLHQATAGSI